MGFRIRGTLPGHCLAGAPGDFGIDHRLSPEEGQRQELLSFGGNGQLRESAFGVPLPHNEVPAVRRADAAGLDTTLQGLGAPARLAAEVTEPGSRCTHQW